MKTLGAFTMTNLRSIAQAELEFLEHFAFLLLKSSKHSGYENDAPLV
jgi:hypothetical protein